jgi:hypothetical protein
MLLPVFVTNKEYATILMWLQVWYNLLDFFYFFLLSTFLDLVCMEEGLNS